MKQLSIEESGWCLQYNFMAPTPGGTKIITIGDDVQGGQRGMIIFTKSDIRAFRVLLKKFENLLAIEEKELKDSDLFDDDIPIKEQIKGK
jgi:hypothetical protein